MNLVRFKAAKALLESMTYKKVPLYVQIQVTPLCNHSCEFCGVIHSFDKRTNLSIEDFRVMRDNLVAMDVGVVVLTGGEPLLRKDIYPIIKLFSDKSIEVRLQTNGSLLTRETVERLNKVKLSGLTISLDSLHQRKMEKLTRTRDFRNTIEAISNAARYGNFNVVALNTVINKSNLHEIEDIVRFGTEMNVFTSLIPIHNENKIFSNIKVQDESNFFSTDKDFAELKVVLDRLRKMKSDGYLIINSRKHLAGIYDFMRYKRYDWRCDSPGLYFSVRPDGTFAPCTEYSTRYRFNDRHFIEIYKSKRFRADMAKIVNACNGCFYPCWCEVSFLVRNPFIVAERFFQLVKHRKNRNINYQAIVDKYVKFD